MPTTTPVSSTDPTTSVNGIVLAGVAGKTLTVNNNLTLRGMDGAGIIPSILQQSGVPVMIPPSGFMQADGTFIIGQAPSSSATVSFSATSGAGVTMTFSAATLLGTAVDVGRVLTILDTTYKYAVITAQSSTTVATVTLTGTLSGTGPFANNTIWLSGGVSTTNATSNTTTFSVPLPTAYSAGYAFFPSTSPIGVNGMYYIIMASTTVGQAYNNALALGTEPSVIGSPTAFSGLTPAAYTQSVLQQTLAGLTLTGGAMGVKGAVLADFDIMIPDDAGNKKAGLMLGASFSIPTFTATDAARVNVRIANKGVANSQTVIGSNPTSFGTTGQSMISRLAVDTSTNQTLALVASVAAATDFVVIEDYTLQLWPNG